MTREFQRRHGFPPGANQARPADHNDQAAASSLAHGSQDARWTVGRVQAVIRQHLRVSLSGATVWRLLTRHGWSWQTPARKALDLDEPTVEPWKSSMTPPHAPHLGPARTHPCPPRLRPLPPPDLRRCTALLQTQRQEPPQPSG
ncbi:winged helix-turn-helix domain-containing protein [Streptomyces sp. NPDC049744]|uniref:helix-turn-helix domain-containing protein n=1 Tax=Streptomyces sp. NPDC049744 TaxID=3154359 RepID=UPI00342867D1